MNYGYDQQDPHRPTNPNRMAVFFPILLSIMLAVGVMLGYQIRPGSMPDGTRNPQDKLQYIIQLVKSNYVDEVDQNELMEKAIAKFLEELDPHSVYMSPEETKRADQELAGNFGGVGIQFMIHKDTLMVTHLVDGGPAQQAGLEPFDRILKVDTIAMTGRHITNEDVFKYLRGEMNTRVKLIVWRKGAGKKKFTFQRGLIPVSSVEASFMLSPTVGYIRISTFAQNTHTEFRQAAIQLLEKGMKNLVFDLRDNGGGLMDQAQLIADEFLKDGNQIVETRGRKVGKSVAETRMKGVLEKTGVIILVNHNTASASEIVAGAIQDNDRGLIIGRRTFGKGLVQRQFEQFGDRSSLRLTIARYYTPSGRCIQKPYGNGIDYYHEQYDRYRNQEFFRPDSTQLTDSLKHKTRYLKRTVYGGGGIWPDVFVPLDTTSNSILLRQLLDVRIMNEFAFDYTENNRNYLKQFKNEDDFVKRFGKNDQLLKEVIDHAKREGIATPEDQLRQSAKAIINLTKAEIARLLFNANGYFHQRMTQDPETQEAMQRMKELRKMRI